MSTPPFALLALASALALAACRREVPPPQPVLLEPAALPAESVTPVAASDEPSAEILDQLAVYAREYVRWRKVDDLAYWAPELCKRPAPPSARVSMSKDAGTHGRKLYYLYARERDAYLRGDAEAESVGQVLVKESFEARPAPSVGVGAMEPGDAYGLFVMARFAPGTPGTDDGWVYATFPPESTQPSVAGRIESCMGCHVREGRGRLFGIADAERAPRPRPARAKSPEQELQHLLAEIPETYESWSRVDQQVRISPLDCRMAEPGEGRLSRSSDDATHGRKLYYLFARDRAGYLLGGARAESVGQIVVKEAWTPERSTRAGGAYAHHPETRRPVSAEIDGVRYETGAAAGLFVMLRVDPATPGTDDGWIYATYPPGSAEPAEHGSIASCMECHVREGRGRLFGLER
jgi:cytochrome c553